MNPWIALALLGACGGSTPEPADVDVVETPIVQVISEEEGVARSEAPLSATLRTIGPAGVSPRHVLIQFNKRLFKDAPVGSEPAGLAVTVTPKIDGALRITAPDLIEFTPDESFLPDTAYTVKIDSVEVEKESIPGDEAWTKTFHTLAFQPIHASLRSRSQNSRQATLEVNFSAPVDANSIGTRLSLEVDGNPVAPTSISQGDPNTVLIAANVGWGRRGVAQKIDIQVGRGVAYAHNPSIKSAVVKSFPVHLPKGPKMQIHHMALKEGQNGYYLEVVCDDDAAKGNRYWYDRTTGQSYSVSGRCILGEAWANQLIRMDPMTNVTVANGPGGFRIFGAFPRGELTVKIDAGAATEDGGSLYNSFTKKFVVKGRSPTVSFTSKGRYLPHSAWNNLGIQHMNVDKLGLTVRHVPRENLVFWLTGDEPLSRRTSNVVVDTKLAVPNTPDTVETSWVPIQELLDEPKNGIYELTLKAGNNQDQARLMLTDMHLVAKAEKPAPGETWTARIRTWALDIHTGEAIDGVRVKLVRASGQSMAECSTVRDKGCTLEPDGAGDDFSPPVALIATKGQDLTYIKMSDLLLDTPSDTSGRPYSMAQPLQSPLYTDRGVYRPGETAHVAGIVRNEAFSAPDSGLPVVVKLFDPKGREVRKRVLHTNSAGMVDADFGFGDYALTGRYRVIAEIGEVTTGEVHFQIEEFVPERLKVTANALKESGTLLSEPAVIAVKSDWLFGGAAKEARYEVGCRLESGRFSAKDYDGFTFGPAHLTGVPRPLSLDTVNGRLSELGRAEVSCPAPEVGSSYGPATVVAQAAVFEGESGRTTTATALAKAHPEWFYIGLDTPATKAKAGKEMVVEGVIVNWNGKARHTKRKLTLETYAMQEEYGWWWDEWEGTSTQSRQLRPAIEHTQTVEIAEDGTFSLAFTPMTDSAGTLIRAKAGNAMTELFVEGSGRRYWWGQSETVVDATPRPMRPVNLPIEVSSSIRTGEVNTLTAIAPFAGRLLFTVETDDIIDSVWMDAVAGPNEWRFRVEEFAPNVYVSAFLIKDPHLESADAFLPDRAFGVESVRIEPEDYEQKITIKAPETVRPYSKLRVEVDVGAGMGDTYATIAAIDEGILSLTQFEDPDPLGEIFTQRALGVSTYETVGWTLLVEPSGPSSSTGGDGDGAPPRVQMVKPVALWSGVVKADANGKAKVSFDVPGYRGKLRVMVVTANKNRVGHASTNVTVKDPLVLQTTLPRFLMTSDEAEIPVMVSNQSGRDQEVTVRLETSELFMGAEPDITDGSPPVPVVTFLSKDSGTLKIKAGEAKTAVFAIRTRDLPGAAHFLVTATAGKLYSKEELDLPIQTTAGDTRETFKMPVTAGVTDLTPQFEGWVGGTDTSTLWVTSNPYAQSMTHLRHLVRYPYG